MELLRRKDFIKTAPQAPQPLSPADLLLNKAVSYITANLNTPLSVSEVSRACGVSESYLYRIFTLSLGMSPKAYIVSCKMEYARTLLKEQNMTVTQIARELGFANPNHFSNAFYKYMGTRPSQYRAD